MYRRGRASCESLTTADVGAGVRNAGLRWLLVVLLVACRGPDAADVRLQPLVDTYAPGLRLGLSIDDSVRGRFRLVPASYVGYAGTAYHGPGGVERLYVHMDAYVDDANPRVPPGARVTGISLLVPSRTRVVAVDTRLRRLLGRPQEVCYAVPMRPSPLRARFWAASRERGVMLVSAPNTPGDTAVLTIGGPSLDTTRLDRRPCPAPTPINQPRTSAG